MQNGDEALPSIILAGQALKWRASFVELFSENAHFYAYLQ